LSGYPEITKKIIARTLIILLAFILGINAFGLYAPKVSAAAGPDLIVQDITLSPPEPTVDDTVTITVAVKNQGTVNAGVNYVACYVDSTILDTKTITSLGPGITVTVAFTWTAQTGSHVVKAIADSSGAIAETDETNNIKTFTFSTLAADLTIQSVSWLPQNPAKGDNVVFTVIIRNQGNSKSSLTNAALYVDGVSKGSQNIDAINPGGTVTKTFNWVAASGQHIIKAVVDENNNTKESDETNNEQSLTLSTIPPDLIIQAVTWTPQNPSRNEVVTFTATIKNQGSGRADSCHLGYYIDNLYVAAIAVNALEAGALCNVIFTWTALPDAHDLKLVIDYYNKIAESDETNNEYTASLSTVAPDLIIKDISWTPQAAGVGDVVTFTVIIKNQGGGKAPASRVAYYISGTYQGYLAIPLLDIGAEVTRTFAWTAEYGSITVTVAADCDNIISESNEANNRVNKSIPIVPADLLISNITWIPVNPAVGDTVVFTVTVKNQGGGKASSYNISYYLDDTLLGSDSIYATNAGASANKTFEWQAQNGRHVFKAVADSTTRVTESDEKNNEYAVTVIPFMPDLAIGAVTWTPLDTPVGAEVTFDINIQNRGALRAGTSRVAYYIDGAAAGYAYIGLLNPGAAAIEHFTWVATTGPHKIDIVADADNQILEIDENNNTKVVTLPPPDLIVKDITYSPTNASRGDALVITTSIKNQGRSKTQSSLVALYVDGNLIASQDLPPIDTGESLDRSFNWVAEAGTHTFKITADIDNTVIETDETNNDKEIQFSTMTPDLVVQGLRWETGNQLNSNEVNFTITVKNIGTGTAGAYKLKYSFDDNPAIIKDMLPIPAGKTAELTFVSILSTGSHTADITVDSNNDVVELNEDNNESNLTFSTIAPDLVVRTITWAPLDAKIGDTITITAKVENQGSAKAIKPRLALSVDGVAAGYADIPEVDIDSVATINFSWTAIAGQHEISVLANSDNTVLESNVSNNAKSRSISFEKPAVPVKKAAGLPAVPSADKGFLNTWWWLLLLVAALLGIGAFVSAFRAARKKY